MSDYGYQPMEWTPYTAANGRKCRVNLRLCCDMQPTFEEGKPEGAMLQMMNGVSIWAQEPMTYFVTGRRPPEDPKATAERLA